MAGEVIVGFDTATPRLTVAAARSDEPDEPIFERDCEPAPGERPAHSRALLAAVEAAAEACGGWDAVDAIAVATGPGSYTGLRIGIATARALAQALRMPLRPASSLAALARGIAPSPGVVARLPVLDARRGQVFAALYGEDGAEVWEPFVATPRELAERLADLGAAPASAGDGSIRFRRELEAAGAEIPPAESDAHRLFARHLCALAGDGPDAEPAAVEPIYLRPPDAELWREQQRREGHIDR